MLSFTRLRRYGILFAHSMKEATFLWFLMQKFREAKLIWTNLLWFVVVFKVSQWLHLDESAQKSAKMNACLQIHVSVGCSSTGTRPRNHFPTWNPLKDFNPYLADPELVHLPWPCRCLCLTFVVASLQPNLDGPCGSGHLPYCPV